MELTLIRALPGVASVGVNHRTGSVLVHHTTSVDELLAAAEREGLFRVVEALGQASVSVPDALTDHLRTLDQRLRSLTGGDLDLRTLSLCTLLGLGVVETVRGNIASPATTLFWYAASLLMLSPGGNPSTNGGPSTEGRALRNAAADRRPTRPRKHEHRFVKLP